MILLNCWVERERERERERLYVPMPPCEGFNTAYVKPNIPNWKANISVEEYIKDLGLKEAK